MALTIKRKEEIRQMVEQHLKEFYTLEQLEQEICVNKQTIRKLIREGQLQASKVGKRLIITRDSINDYLKKNIVTK